MCFKPCYIIMKWCINPVLPAISDTELETKFELIY